MKIKPFHFDIIDNYVKGFNDRFTIQLCWYYIYKIEWRSPLTFFFFGQWNLYLYTYKYENILQVLGSFQTKMIHTDRLTRFPYSQKSFWKFVLLVFIRTRNIVHIDRLSR